MSDQNLAKISNPTLPAIDLLTAKAKITPITLNSATKSLEIFLPVMPGT